ncbi:MAG TPA: DUF2062 domain-containing protein, partial [Verrucomicrobiae bacterium]|nr:DUF2062 domain-containing protein [Verrucomicrobiae bacterium]
MNLRKWFEAHSLKLLAIRDTPEAIASGVAIGIFFGFTPLFGLKTLLSLFLAWLTRSNLIAAVIAVTLHDLLFPFMPFIYRMEYDVGYWLLSNPHHLPVKLRHMNWADFQWRSWTTFLTVGKPWLLGSVVCALPAAALAYVMSKKIVH